MRRKSDDLNIMITEHNPDVIVLSETWFKSSTQFTIHGYAIARKDRDDGYGGVLLACKSSLRTKRLQINTAHECVACEIQFSDRQKINVASIYLPPSGQQVTVASVKNMAQQIPHPKMLLGDFNAIGQQWGNTTNDRRTAILNTVFDDDDLVTLNTGAFTRVACPPVGNSAIDLSVCSTYMALDCTWTVLDHTYGSDHLPILVNYNLVNIRPDLTGVSPINTKHINWTQYAHLVRQAINDNIINTQTALEKYDHLAGIIIESSRAASTTNSQWNVRLVPKPWWCPELSVLYAAKKKAFDTFKRIGGQIEYVAYKHEEAKFKLLKSQRKKEKWKEVCSSFNKDTSLSKMYAWARRFRGQSRQQHRTISSGNWYAEFASNLAPPFVPVQERFTTQVVQYVDTMTEPYELTELEAALARCKNTTPGLDQISFVLIKNLDHQAKLLLLSLFNDFVLFQCFPKQWSVAKVVAILKPDKNPEEATSYRPICLLSCLRKLFEKMLQTRIDHWWESNKKSARTQFGFKKGFGTNDCITILTTDIATVYAQKSICLAAFLDISAAYDNVRIDILCDRLIRMNCPTAIVATISQLFARRSLHFHFNNHAGEIREGYKGLAQGSALSPLLFNIYTRDIEDHVPRSVKFLQYADDVVIYASGRNQMHLQYDVQLAIDAVERQYKVLGLDIAPNKSEMMVFTRKYIVPAFQLLVSSHQLRQSTSFKYLGVVFDSKCLWKQQIEHISKRCVKRINFMRTISSSDWGAHPETLLVLYKATVRSVMEYGCNAFFQAAETHITRLRKIQNRGLRASLGVLSSTHIGSLEAIAGIPPIDLRWKLLYEKHTIKSIAGPSKRLRTSLINLANITPDHQRIIQIRDWLNSTGYRSFPCYSFPLREVLFKPIISWAMKTAMADVPNISPSEVTSMYATTFASLQPSTMVFTDGSQSPNGTGAAVYVSNNTSITCKLRPPATVFDAELTAILLACKTIRTMLPGRYVIASDSMSVLAALQNNEPSTKSRMALVKCRSILCLLTQSSYWITLLWIPSHVGIEGNEKADVLAKEAAINAVESPHATEWHSRMPLLKAQSINLWQLRWDKGDLGRFCHSIIPHVSLNLWSKKIDEAMDRAELKTAIRIVSNHYTLKNHLNRFNITDTALCTCGAYESVDHVLFDCGATSRNRNALLRTLQTNGFRRPFETRHILATTRSGEVIRGIHEYLKSNEIKL